MLDEESSQIISQGGLILQEKHEPHQLKLAPEVDSGDVVQALVMSAYDCSPVVLGDNLKGYKTTLPDYLAKELILKSTHPDERDLCVIGQNFGRDVNIAIRMDADRVIGLYDTVKLQPLAFERANAIYKKAAIVYETILEERENEQSRSKEPLVVQLHNILEKIEAKFAGVDPLPHTLKTADTPAPSVSDVVYFLQQIQGWVKTENPGFPDVISYHYPNGDYLTAEPIEHEDVQTLTVNFHNKGDSLNSSPQTLWYLNASLEEDPNNTSFLSIETYGGHNMDFRVGPKKK